MPRPLVCQVRYTVSPSRRNTFTANPPSGGAPTSAPNGLFAVEYQVIVLPTRFLYASASSIGPWVTITNRASKFSRTPSRVNCEVNPVQPRHCHSLVREPHVVVDDQLRLAVEDVGEPDRAVLALQRVVGHLDHGQPAALRGDGVELPRRGLLADAQRVELLLPGVGVDDGR